MPKSLNNVEDKGLVDSVSNGNNTVYSRAQIQGMLEISVLLSRYNERYKLSSDRLGIKVSHFQHPDNKVPKDENMEKLRSIYGSVSAKISDEQPSVRDVLMSLLALNGERVIEKILWSEETTYAFLLHAYIRHDSKGYFSPLIEIFEAHGVEEADMPNAEVLTHKVYKNLTMLLNAVVLFSYIRNGKPFSVSMLSSKENMAFTDSKSFDSFLHQMKEEDLRARKMKKSLITYCYNSGKELFNSLKVSACTPEDDGALGAPKTNKGMAKTPAAEHSAALQEQKDGITLIDKNSTNPPAKLQKPAPSHKTYFVDTDESKKQRIMRIIAISGATVYALLSALLLAAIVASIVEIYRGVPVLSIIPSHILQYASLGIMASCIPIMLSSCLLPLCIDDKSKRNKLFIAAAVCMVTCTVLPIMYFLLKQKSYLIKIVGDSLNVIMSPGIKSIATCMGLCLAVTIALVGYYAIALVTSKSKNNNFFRDIDGETAVKSPLAAPLNDNNKAPGALSAEVSKKDIKAAPLNDKDGETPAASSTLVDGAAAAPVNVTTPLQTAATPPSDQDNPLPPVATTDLPPTAIKNVVATKPNDQQQDRISA